MDYNTHAHLVSFTGETLQRAEGETLVPATMGATVLELALAPPVVESNKGALFDIARKVSEANQGDGRLSLFAKEVVLIKDQAEKYSSTLAYGILCELLEGGGVEDGRESS